MEEILEKVGQVSVSDSSIWRRTQECGEQFCGIVEQERIKANVLPEQWWDGPHGKQDAVGRLGAAMDGTKIHIREEGWKELKIGCIFDVQTCPSLDPITDEVVELARAVNNSYVAHLGGPEMLGQMMWAEAARRKWEQASDTEVIGDGAP